MKSILTAALLNALSTALYVTVVGSFLFYAAQMRLGQGRTILVPIAMLMLLVFSAALVVVLIFGRPLLWYLYRLHNDLNRYFFNLSGGNCLLFPSPEL